MQSIRTNHDPFIKKSSFLLQAKNKANGLDLLDALCPEIIKTAFFDPQYRGIMDKMKYGNEGARQKQRVALQQMDKETIIQFINGIDRVLAKSGYLFLWIDKFHLCEGVHTWIEETQLQIVDLITWDKTRMGMGYRTRRQCEYLLVLQKKPIKAKTTWSIHTIRDIHSEKVNPKEHPHSKPIQLQKELISATTNEEDYVLDPAAGSYSVLQACEALNRTFIGSDIKG